MPTNYAIEVVDQAVECLERNAVPKPWRIVLPLRQFMDKRQCRRLRRRWKRNAK